MVLSCNEFKEEISSLIDGELDQHRQTALSEHVTNCGGCKSDHDQFKNLGQLLQRSANTAQSSAPDLWTALTVKMPSVCDCVQDDLSAYLDGELIASAKEGVSMHLEQCSVCLTKFQQLSNVTGLLSKGLVLPESIEVDIWTQINTRLNEDCILIKSELSSFIDREVVTLRHRAITSHLTECADCTMTFNNLNESGDVLRNYYQPEIPEDFDLWPAIQGNLNVVPFQARERQPKAPHAVRRLYAVAAAVIIGVLGTSGYVWYQNTNAVNVEPVTAEAYLIDQSLGEPADVAEAVVYDHATP